MVVVVVLGSRVRAWFACRCWSDIGRLFCTWLAFCLHLLSAVVDVRFVGQPLDLCDFLLLARSSVDGLLCFRWCPVIVRRRCLQLLLIVVFD